MLFPFPARERRLSPLTSPSTIRRASCSLVLAALAGACVLAPAGLREERDRVDEAGKPYEPPREERALPELSGRPDWRELLGRAFAANGELEAIYFEWQAALQRVAIAAGWPNTNLAPSFSYMLSGERLKTWDRMTVNVGFDPMQNLAFPRKVAQAGEVALAETREAGRRFTAAKFALQRNVLESWLALELLDEESRIQRERVHLARLFFDSAAQRAAVGGEYRDLLRAQVEQREAEIGLEGLETRVRASHALLNGWLARATDAPLELEGRLPEPRSLPLDDAALMAAGVENNPELEALAFAVSGRQEALELARLQYIPDFNPFAGFTGSIQQTIGVGLSLPTRLPQIRAGIDEARARLRGAQARLQQTQFDRRASFVAALYVLRYSERQAEFIARQIRPAAEQVLDSAQQAYATGEASFLELIDAQRVLLDVRLGIAEARIERERRLAELEALAGLDIEALAARAAQPASAPEGSEDDRHE